jgi:hypothetical protein
MKVYIRAEWLINVSRLSLVSYIVDICLRIPRSHWNRRNRFRGLIETAKAASAVSLKPRNPLPRSHWNCRSDFRGLIETAEADIFKRLSRISRWFRSHMRNGFNPWIRELGGVDWWKNWGSKIWWHCPFKNVKTLYSFLLFSFTFRAIWIRKTFVQFRTKLRLLYSRPYIIYTV